MVHALADMFPAELLPTAWEEHYYAELNQARDALGAQLSVGPPVLVSKKPERGQLRSLSSPAPEHAELCARHAYARPTKVSTQSCDRRIQVSQGSLIR